MRLITETGIIKYLLTPGLDNISSNQLIFDDINASSKVQIIQIKIGQGLVGSLKTLHLNFTPYKLGKFYGIIDDTMLTSMIDKLIKIQT